MGQSQSQDGRLQAAVASGQHEEFAQAVFEHGASALRQPLGSQGQTGVHQFAGAGNNEAIDAVVKAYTNRHMAKRRSFGAKDSLKCQSTVANLVDDHGATPLMLAAQHGHVECVKYLLSCMADPVARDNHSCTAMHYAAASGAAPMLRILAGLPQSRHHKLLDRPNEHGFTPLHFAVWHDQQQAVTELCEQLGAAIDSRTYGDFTTGCSTSNIYTGTNIQCIVGSTPLHLAAMTGSLSTVKILLRAHRRAQSLRAALPSSGQRLLPDLRSIQDSMGYTPLDIAIQWSRSALLTALHPQVDLQQVLAVQQERTVVKEVPMVPSLKELAARVARQVLLQQLDKAGDTFEYLHEHEEEAAHLAGPSCTLDRTLAQAYGLGSAPLLDGAAAAMAAPAAVHCAQAAGARAGTSIQARAASASALTQRFQLHGAVVAPLSSPVPTSARAMLQEAAASRSGTAAPIGALLSKCTTLGDVQGAQEGQGAVDWSALDAAADVPVGHGAAKSGKAGFFRGKAAGGLLSIAQVASTSTLLNPCRRVASGSRNCTERCCRTMTVQDGSGPTDQDQPKAAQRTASAHGGVKAHHGSWAPEHSTSYLHAASTTVSGLQGHYSSWEAGASAAHANGSSKPQPHPPHVARMLQMLQSSSLLGSAQVPGPETLDRQINTAIQQYRMHRLTQTLGGSHAAVSDTHKQPSGCATIKAPAAPAASQQTSVCPAACHKAGRSAPQVELGAPHIKDLRRLQRAVSRHKPSPLAMACSRQVARQGSGTCAPWNQLWGALHGSLDEDGLLEESIDESAAAAARAAGKAAACTPGPLLHAYRDGGHGEHQLPAAGTSCFVTRVMDDLVVDEDEEWSDMCGVCMDEGDFVQLSCRHKLCVTCARELVKLHSTQLPPCPFCRAMISGFRPAVHSQPSSRQLVRVCCSTSVQVLQMQARGTLVHTFN